MKELVCIDNSGMEEHLSVGSTYTSSGKKSGNLIEIFKLDTGYPGLAFPARFVEKAKDFPLYKKPRKAKQKPLTRQKSDITVSYKNGKSYTLKNICALYIQGDVFQVTRKEQGAAGVEVTRTFKLSNVTIATLRTPGEVVSISVIGKEIIVDTLHHSFSADYYFWEA